MILANRQDSEDVVQQVFARLLQRRANVKPDAVEAYLRTAVRNECFSLLRVRQRTNATGDQTLLETVAIERDSNPDERLALEAALRELPADQREVVHLKAFDGLTFQEIADLTSGSINTVASRWRYAMEKLRTVLRSRPS